MCPFTGPTKSFIDEKEVLTSYKWVKVDARTDCARERYIGREFCTATTRPVSAISVPSPGC